MIVFGNFLGTAPRFANVRGLMKRATAKRTPGLLLFGGKVQIYTVKKTKKTDALKKFW